MSASNRSDSAFTIIFTPGTHLRTGTFIEGCKDAKNSSLSTCMKLCWCYVLTECMLVIQFQRVGA